MLLPDGRPLIIDAGILAEPASDGRLILWVPSERTSDYQHWHRVGTAAHATVTITCGIGSIAATAVPIRQRLGSPFVKFFRNLRRSASTRTVTMPDGTSGEQHGLRQADLRLAWSVEDAVSLDAAQLTFQWPTSQRSQRLGENLFIVWGLEPEPIKAEPPPPPGPSPHESPRTIAEQALASAQQSGDPRRIITAAADLGLAAIYEGQAARADVILREALKEAQRLGDRAQEADLLSTLGLAANTLNQPQQAKMFLGAALASTQASGDRYAEKLALDRLAVTYVNLNDPAGALAHLEQAIAIAAVLHDAKHEADLHWRAAILYADLGQVPQANRSAQNAVQLLRHLGHPTAGWYADHLAKYQSGESGVTLPPVSPAPPYFGGAIDAGALSAPPPRSVGQGANGPGLLRMAVTSVKAMTTFVGSGFKTASPPTYRDRLAVCATCEHHTGVRCRICGCITAAKAKLLHERCPAGRWRG